MEKDISKLSIEAKKILKEFIDNRDLSEVSAELGKQLNERKPYPNIVEQIVKYNILGIGDDDRKKLIGAKVDQGELGNIEEEKDEDDIGHRIESFKDVKTYDIIPIFSNYKWTGGIHPDQRRMVWTSDQISERRKGVYDEILNDIEFIEYNDNLKFFLKRDLKTQRFFRLLLRAYDKWFFNNELVQRLYKDHIKVQINVATGFEGRDRDTAAVCTSGTCYSKIVFNMNLFDSVYFSDKDEEELDEPVPLGVKVSKEEEVNGLTCHSKLECMLIVFEHELVHVFVENYGDAYVKKYDQKYKIRDHDEMFEEVSKSLFGHTKMTHRYAWIKKKSEGSKKKSESDKKMPRRKIGQRVIVLDDEFGKEKGRGRIIFVGGTTRRYLATRIIGRRKVVVEYDDKTTETVPYERLDFNI